MPVAIHYRYLLRCCYRYCCIRAISVGVDRSVVGGALCYASAATVVVAAWSLIPISVHALVTAL